MQHGIGTVTGNPNAGKKNCINYCKACLQLSGVQNGHALLEKKGTAKAEEKDDKNMAYYLIDYEQFLILKSKYFENKFKRQEKTIDFLVNKLNCQDELNEYMKGEKV